MLCIFADLSIDTNDDHIQDNIESGHNGQNGHNGHMAVMEWYNMATNMAVIGVYGKMWQNADHP